jgi:hypothetical protein
MTWLRPHVAADALAAGPWCWPRAGERLDRTVARLGDVPAPDVGSIAAVTVQSDTVVLWHLARGLSGGKGATLGPAMRASWREAGIALPRGLPVLWHSMHDATARPPDIAYLASIRGSPGVPDLRYPLDGPSFGLAFLLSLASIVLDCALPGDIVASAAVDAAGNVGPVGGLEQKVAGVIRMAPHVTRFIVAAAQRVEAETHAGNYLRVVPVTHAAEAVDIAFAEQLSGLIVGAGQDPLRRDELTASFFRLALMGSDVLVDWAPVRRGARLALDRWTDLPADARYALEFAHAVAARHDVNAGAVGLPPEGWLAARPRMVRVQVIAHLVQQSADTGTPAPAIIEPHALGLLDHAVEESSPPELRLRGALARLHAVTGRAAMALAGQERLARAFAEIYADSDIAYPLAEWARLAGALRDDASLRRAQHFHDRMRGAGSYRGLGPSYVELALVRGRLLLDPRDTAAREIAAQLGADVALPDHVRWSADRWAGAVRRDALTLAERRGAVAAARNLELAQLDDALLAGNATAANACVDAIERYDPGPVGHLRRAGATPADIARLYPY